MQNTQSRTADKFVVRLPDGMRDKIAAIAATNHRSMNSEIVMSLEKLVDEATPIATSGPLAQSPDEIRILEAFRGLSSTKKAAALLILGGAE